METKTMAEVKLLEETEGPKSSNPCKLWTTIKDLYLKYFPTDTASYNVKVPFLAMTCSLTIVYIPISQHYLYINIMILFFLLMLSGATYQLYYGLKIGDKKQLMPWLVLKFIEIILTLGIGTYFLISYLAGKRFNFRYLIPWKYIVMGFLMLIAVIDIWIYVIVIMRWNKLRKEENLRAGNVEVKRSFTISGIWRAIKEFYRNYFPTDTATLNVRIPLLAIACSFTLTYLIMAQFYYIRVIFFAYLLVISGATYQLYYGLKIGDKKQLMPWMLLKSTEITFTMTIGVCLVIKYVIDESNRLNPPDAWTYIIISFLLKVATINIWTYVVVIIQWNKLNKEEKKKNLSEILEVFDPDNIEITKAELTLIN